MGARRFALHTIQRAADISIHAPRMGARHKPFFSADGMLAFQSTRPAWGATALYLDEQGINKAISIHAPRMGARRAV